MTRSIRLLAAASVLALGAAAEARPPMMGRGGRMFGPPAFMRHLYAPRLVMRNQEAIDLTAEQRRAITGAIAETRTRLGDLERTRAGAADALGALVATPRVDEQAALAQAAELMATEQEIKRAHLGLLIRVKNVLTPEQQHVLDGLSERWRAERRRRLRDRPRPPGPDAPGEPDDG